MDSGLATRNQLFSLWVGALTCIVGLVGLVTQLEAPSERFFPDNNISTIEVRADCDALANLYVVFDFEKLGRSDDFDIFVGLERPMCNSLSIEIDGGIIPGEDGRQRAPTYSGTLKIGEFRGLTSISGGSFYGTWSEGQMRYDHTYEVPSILDGVERKDHRLDFDLSAVNVDGAGQGVLYLNARFEGAEGGDLGQVDVVRRISGSKKRVLAHLYVDARNIDASPKVYNQFSSELDVIPLNARAQDQGFFHGGGAKVFLLEPTSLDGFTSGLVLSERQGQLWGISYDIVSLAAERRVTGLIVLFSALIGVGASLFFEGILSIELLKLIKRS